MTTISVSLPDDLAQRARDAGLLAPAALGDVLQNELLRRQAGARLLQMTEPIVRGWPAMTETEIQALVQEAVDAVRVKGRGPGESGS